MVDETRQVLEMLAEGKVTAEQAAELLDAMDDRPAPPSYSPPPSAPRNRPGQRKHSRLDSPLQQLAHARLQGVSSEYAQEMREAGYDNLTLEELTHLKTLGVDSDFVAELRDMGFTDISVDDLAELKVTGINAEYVREMRALGYLDSDLPAPAGSNETAGTMYRDDAR